MRHSLVKIGEAIRQRRALLGLVQPELAALSGVSTRTIQLIEQGKANPSLEILIRLAAALGLTLRLELRDPLKDDEA